MTSSRAARSADVTALVRHFAELLHAVTDEREFDTVIPRLDGLLHALPRDDTARQTIELATRHGHEVIRRLRKRERELSALYETAGEIARESDLDSALDAITMRARQLIGSDVAYLMLMDADGQHGYMRATAGTVTVDFQHIRLSVGLGLGGTVVADGQPHWSAHYTNDPRYQQRSDDILLAEAIIAILGVPLRVGNRVIGVLFAADRYAREFSAEEVALLCSLADHAAIAIQSKATMAEREQAYDELARTQQEAQRAAQEVARAADVHERMTRIVALGGQVTDVLAVVSRHLRRQVLLLDRSGEVRGSDGGREWPESSRLVAVRSQLDDVARTMRPMAGKRAADADAGDTSETCIVPVAADGQVHAFLVVEGNPLSTVELRTAERAAVVVALLEIMARARSEAEQRLRGSFLIDLLTGEIDTSILRRRADLLGIDTDAPFRFVVATMPEDDALGADVLSWFFPAVSMSVWSTWHGRLVMLVSDAPDLPTRLESFRERLAHRSGRRVTVGYSAPARGFDALRHAYVEADRCVDALQAFGRAGELGTASEFGALGFMVRTADSAAIVDFVAGQLAELERRDHARGTKLIETVETYLRVGASPGQAARELAIHVNTLYQRLDRVAELLGEDWRLGEKGMQLQLAIALRRLLRPHTST